MKKYEILTDNFEFRMGTKKFRIPEMEGTEIFNDYLSGSSNDPAFEKSFCDKKEAMEYFKEHYANYGRTYLEHGSTEYLLVGEIAWLEENEYDEDDEFVQSHGTLALSAQGYTPDDDE